MLYNPTFLYTFVFSISWLLKPAMYAYKYRLAFLSETNRWLSINYQTKKVCQLLHPLHFVTKCENLKNNCVHLQKTNFNAPWIHRSMPRLENSR